MLVDVEIVAFEKIVGNIDIGPAVQIDIPHGDAEAEADDAAEDAGLRRNVHEAAVIIAEQLIATPGVPFVANIAVAQSSYGPKGVIEQVEVQIAVPVVVEKDAVRTEAAVGQSVRGRFFFKGSVALVDKQFVFLVVALDVAGVADVNIQPAVAIDVGHRHPGRPAPRSRYAGRFGHVLELQIAPIEVEPVGQAIGAEVDIGQAVVINVADGYAAAIVIVAVAKYIEVAVGGQLVDEVDAGFRGGESGILTAGSRSGRLRSSGVSAAYEDDRCGHSHESNKKISVQMHWSTWF